MTEVQHFAHGWISPVLAYVLSFLGCLLGLTLAARSRASTGASRARWLTLAALAIGGCGTWLAHFMALLGFDVPATVVRYDVPTTAIGFGIAISVLCLGLYLVGYGRPTGLRIVLAGTVTGIGLAATHSSGALAMRVVGEVRFEPRLALIAVGTAIVGATVTLWFAAVIRGGSASVIAAVIMAVAAGSTHHTVMAAVRVRLDPAVGVPPEGVGLLSMLAPVCVVAAVLLSGLAYSTVGFSVRQDTVGERALLARTHDMYAAAALVRGHRNLSS